HIGPRRVDAVLGQDVGVRVGRIFGGVDAVAYHPNPFWGNLRVHRQHIGPHPVRHRYHRGRFSQRHPLRPGRERVPAAELLGLPRAQRFERVHRGDVRYPVQQRREVPGEVGVPGVRVHQAGPGHRVRHRKVGGKNLQRRVPQDGPRLVRHGRVPWHPLAVHGQVDQRRERARQVLDVDAGPSVHLRRVLPRQQRYLNLIAGHGGTTWPLPTTVMPPAETTNPRARSCSLSTPTLAPSGTTTFLSMIASLISACRPTITLCSSTARSTVDQEFTRTPGDSTDWRTRPPETMTPLDTRESIARPTRSPSSCTNFAGGSGSMWVRIGQRLL